METLSNFGERALAQLPADQVVAHPLGVVEVLEDVSGGAAQGHRHGGLGAAATARALPLLCAVAAVHDHVATVGHWHHTRSLVALLRSQTAEGAARPTPSPASARLRARY